MSNASVLAYLTTKISESKNEEETNFWNEAEKYYNKKLWHQLTTILLVFVKSSNFRNGLQIYESFISDFETKINPLSLVDICIPIWIEMPNKTEVLSFIEKIGEKVKSNEEAFVLTRVIVGTLHLEHFKHMEETKKIIEEVDELLNRIKGVGKVHARYYYLASDYYKQEGNHAKYYRSSLHYLGCTDITELNKASREFMAYHLGLAAILGIGIYNFGELLAHPILVSLANTENEWIVQLLSAFNSGDVRKYEELKIKWNTQPDLATNADVMFQKLCLLALMEIAFQRIGQDRLITFGDIASKTSLPTNQVELLVMKALAKGLIKGTIDQVHGSVLITWVQPRVLDIPQLKTISEKINIWIQSISSLENVVESNAAEIITV